VAVYGAEGLPRLHESLLVGERGRDACARPVPLLNHREHEGSRQARRGMPSADRAFRLVLAAALLCNLPPPRPVAAEPVALQALAQEAEIVALATCTTTESRWDATDPIIVTRVELRVERFFKGEAGSTLPVNTLGGRVGPQGMGASDTAAFTAGERVVAFLRRSAYGPYYVTIGGSAGKLRVEGSPAAPLVRAGGGEAIDLATFAAWIAAASGSR
jgi:hypothetical protein